MTQKRGPIIYSLRHAKNNPHRVFECIGFHELQCMGILEERDIDVS